MTMIYLDSIANKLANVVADELQKITRRHINQTRAPFILVQKGFLRIYEKMPFLPVYRRVFQYTLASSLLSDDAVSYVCQEVVDLLADGATSTNWNENGIFTPVGRWHNDLAYKISFEKTSQV